MRDVLGRLRPDAKVIYMGYPGLELDRDYTVYVAKSGKSSKDAVSIGQRIQYLQTLIESKQQAMVDYFNSIHGSGTVRFVKMRAASAGHENTGDEVVSRSNVRAVPGDVSNRDPWQWDAFENSPFEISDVGPGGKDFYFSGDALWSPVMLHQAEYYHYNPIGHASVAEQIRIQGADTGLVPTGSGTGNLKRGLSIPTYIRGGDCVLSTRWGGFYSPGLNVTVSGAGTATYDAMNGSGCVNLPIVGPSFLDVHVVIPEFGVDQHFSYPVVVTDDGDAVPAASDNCPSIANAFQGDVDADGQGDVCDTETTGSEWWVGDPSTWASPPLSRVFGEPHLVTLDGLAYDFQAAGEFVVMAVPSRAVEVQARFEPTGPGSSVSWTSAMAVRVGSDRVEVRPGTGGVPEVWLNGSLTSLDSVVSVGLGGAVYRAGSSVVVQTYRGVVMEFSTGALAVKVAPGIETSGLLGDHNGSVASDLKRADGVVVDPGDRVGIYSGFADSWRVTTETSLFTYAAGMSTASFTDRAFPPTVTTLADFTPVELDAATATCGAAGVRAGAAMDSCALDLLVTKQETFLAAAAAAPPAVDPTAVAFTAGGLLVQSFDAAVSASFGASRYVSLANGSVAAGPFVDSTNGEPAYKFALVSVPRHSQVAVSVRVLVTGATESDGETQKVSIDVDGSATGVVRLEGGGQMESGPAGTTVAFAGTGTLVDGTPFGTGAPAGDRLG